MPYMPHALQESQDTTLLEQALLISASKTMRAGSKITIIWDAGGLSAMIPSRKCDQLIETTLGDAHRCRKGKLFHRQGWQKDKYRASLANKMCDFKFCAYTQLKFIPAPIKLWSPKGSLGDWDRGGHSTRRSGFLLSEGFRSPRLNFSCHLPTSLLFLAILLGLYSGNGCKFSQSSWTHNCSRYCTPTSSATLVPLVLPFPTGTWVLSVRSPRLGKNTIQNCSGLWTVRAGSKEPLMLEAAEKNRSV